MKREPLFPGYEPKPKSGARPDSRQCNAKPGHTSVSCRHMHDPAQLRQTKIGTRPDKAGIRPKYRSNQTRPKQEQDKEKKEPGPA